MKNIVIDNLLTQESIVLIKDIIDLELKRENIWVESGIHYLLKKEDPKYVHKKEDTVGVVKSDFARIDLQNLKIPEKIINEISQKLVENNLIGYKYCKSSTVMMYNKNLGNPKLTEHIDKTEDKDTIMVDYQLESNTDWGIRVEDVNYVLSDNQALIFWGNQQRHSRSFKKFNDKEFVTNIIFRFNFNENIYL